MRNTPEEIAKFTVILDELEDGLFEAIKTARAFNDKDARQFRATACELLLYLQTDRWNLNNEYGFDPVDASSRDKIKKIENFLKTSR